MKQRVVISLTILLLLGLGTFVGTSVITNQQENAFEDLQIESDLSPDPNASATTPCPSPDDGSYPSPECASISVQLLYQYHEKDPQALEDKPRMRLKVEDTKAIDGRIDDIEVLFYCHGQAGVKKDVSDVGVAAVSRGEMGCPLEQVRAKVLKYLTDDDAPNQIPRKETTRMYYLYFRDFDISDLRDQIGNYIDSKGEIRISNDIGLVVGNSGKKVRKIIGIQPAVGGIAKVEGNDVKSRTVCFSYLKIENLGDDFPCDDLQTMIRTTTDENGWYMLGTSITPWDPPTIPLLNNFDKRLNFGKFIALVRESEGGVKNKNVYVTAQNTDTLKWLEFEKFKNNPKQLIGGHGEGLTDNDSTKWNRKDCDCFNKRAEIYMKAYEYVNGTTPLPIPGFSPCSYFVTTSLKVAGVFRGIESICIELNKILHEGAVDDILQQLTPPLPQNWSPYSDDGIDHENLGLVPGDIIVFTGKVGGVVKNHTAIYAGKHNGKNSIIHSSPPRSVAIRRGVPPNTWIAHTYLSGVRLIGGQYRSWSTFSYKCWNGVKLPP